MNIIDSIEKSWAIDSSYFMVTSVNRLKTPEDKRKKNDNTIIQFITE